MALIKWGDEEDKKDDLFGSPIKQISSVQSGAWQPAPSGADAPAMMGESDQGNYLLSDEKAKVDEQKRQRDAQIELARQQDAEQARVQAQEQAAQKPKQERNVVDDGLDAGKSWEQIAEENLMPVNAVRDYSQATRPNYGITPVKRLNQSFVNKVRDVFDANTDSDKFRRYESNIDNAGNPDKLEQVQLEDPGNLLTQMGSHAVYLGKGFGAGSDDAQVANADQISLQNQYAASMRTAKKRLEDPSLSEEERARWTEFYVRTANNANYLNQKFSKEIVDQIEATNPAKGAAAVGVAGLDVLSAGMTGVTGKELLKQGIKQGIKSQARTIGANALLNTASGAGSGYVDGQDAAGIIESGLISGTLGTIADVGLATTGELASKALRRGGAEVAGDVAGDVAGELTPARASGVADDVNIPNEVTPINDGNISFEKPVNMASEAPVPVGRVADAIDSTPAYQRGYNAEPVTPVTPRTNEQLALEATIRKTQDLEPTEDLTPAFQRRTDEGVTPVADGVPLEQVVPVRATDTPAVTGEDVRALQDARAGKSQAEEAVINQKLQQAQDAVPAIDNVPDMPVTPDGRLTPAQVAERLMPKLADNADVKARIADAVDMGKDTASPLRDILSEGGVKPKQAERIATQFDTLEKQLMEYNRLAEANQKAYAEGGADALDENVSRERSRAAREMGTTTRRLMTEIKRLEGSRDYKTRLINSITDILGTRNASVLSSAGLLERNITQELTANAKLALKNPVKMLKSTFGNGNILKDTAKSELSHWKDAPRNPIEAVKYVVGNVYRTGMIPTTALSNTRRGAVRDELTKWAFQELEGRKVSSKEARKLSGTAGNEMEALVNTFIGVDNGMTNRKQATDALKAWKEYIRTGDDGAKAEFLQKVEQHNSLADQMISGLSKEDAVRAKGLMAVKNLIFPFVRTATNLAKNTFQQDLNPFAKSLIDEIGADQLSGGANAVNLIKSKLVDYGIMTGAAALASSGALVYNDGDEVDKPRGWSLKTGDSTFVPVRATSLELPIAMAGAAQQMADDISNGKPRDWQYYAGMITGSLPYIDQFNTTTGAVDSVMSGEDEGYAAKSYGVNMAKSFVPFSNNGVQPYVAGKQGESLNAKTVYDDDLKTWFSNAVRKSYDPEFYDTLKDSRDNAGRVRTVDNQGVVSNKTINDAPTAEFNDRITGLVEYGREAGLGKNTQDMFNTYDTGKNNNFKSVQDSITFLDAVDGKPDNTKKLEKNAKLTDLATQIREGFYGDAGSELLTLDGKNIYSDVSVPNKDGTKNSKLPLSMQSIKNAIAQTDLPEEQRNIMFEVSQRNDDLYAQLKEKSISYDQYVAAKAENEKTYTDILNSSESYQKMLSLFDELDQTGFFEADGLGSTRSGQTYLWNSLNALLGSKGATPAANYPDDSKGFTPWGNRGTGRSATNKPGDRGNTGVQFSPVKARQMANVAYGKYTPVNIKVRLGNEIRRDKTQNYSDRSF